MKKYYDIWLLVICGFTQFCFSEGKGLAHNAGTLDDRRKDVRRGLSLTSTVTVPADYQRLCGTRSFYALRPDQMIKGHYICWTERSKNAFRNFQPVYVAYYNNAEVGRYWVDDQDPSKALQQAKDCLLRSHQRVEIVVLGDDIRQI